MSESQLDRVRVVLFETQNLINVGATMRAMKNMGLSDLRLVNAVPLDAWRLQGIAHDTGDILARTREHASLDEAIADCVLVAAFTARHRSARWDIATPREISGRLLDAIEDGPVALLFGREDRGLPNEALDRAQVHVTIPTSRYASLNLAQAVMVALVSSRDRVFRLAELSWW
jgi:TrmH family RNA methyltransferase